MLNCLAARFVLNDVPQSLYPISQKNVRRWNSTNCRMCYGVVFMALAFGNSFIIDSCRVPWALDINNNFLCLSCRIQQNHVQLFVCVQRVGLVCLLHGSIVQLEFYQEIFWCPPIMVSRPYRANSSDRALIVKQTHNTNKYNTHLNKAFIIISSYQEQKHTLPHSISHTLNNTNIYMCRSNSCFWDHTHARSLWYSGTFIE